MLVQLSPAVRILPPSGATGDRWVAEDLLRKRRFTITRPAAAALVAAAEPQDLLTLAMRLGRGQGADAVEVWQSRLSNLLQHELVVAPEAVSDDPNLRWLTELVAEWERARWREAAEYHILAFDYPCIDYSEASAIGVDRSRMREYQAVEPDDNRYKLDYLDRPGIVLPEPSESIPTASAKALWTEDSSPRTVAVDTLMATISLAFGVTEERTPVTESAPLLRRTSPSGGGRNPSEGYLLVWRVPGMEPGWYHITLRPFTLRLIRSDTPDDRTMRTLFPDMHTNPPGPAAMIMVTSVFERNMYRYREPRTFRTVHMDAGHIVGTARLVAEALGLRAVVGDAGDAPAIESLLGLDGMTEGYLVGLALYDGASGHHSNGVRPARTSVIVPNRDPAEAADGICTTVWPVGSRIRPSIRTDEPEIEVADTVTGRTVRFQPVELAEVILLSDEPPAEIAKSSNPQDEQHRAALLPGLQHWQRRGWHPSDQYYVASRRARDGSGHLDGTDAGVEPGIPATDGPAVALPAPASPGEQSMARLLLGRRTGRAYIRRPVAASTLSGLLWYGFADFRGSEDMTRSVEHWNLTAWEVCLCIYNVEGIDPGAYRYDPVTHELHPARHGDHRAEMIGVLQGMRSPSSAGWTLGLVADFARYQRLHPGETGLRSLYTQAGVLAQEVIVLGGSYSLSALATPAQQDSAYLRLHGLSRRRHGPIYTLTMGLSRGADGVYPDDGPLDETDAQG